LLLCFLRSRPACRRRFGRRRERERERERESEGKRKRKRKRGRGLQGKKKIEKERKGRRRRRRRGRDRLGRGGDRPPAAWPEAEPGGAPATGAHQHAGGGLPPTGRETVREGIAFEREGEMN